MQMGGLISVLKGGNKRAVEEIDRNSNFYPPALKLLQREFGNQLFIRHFKKKNFSSNHQYGEVIKPLCNNITPL